MKAVGLLAPTRGPHVLVVWLRMAWIGSVWLGVACSGHRDTLARGQSYYEDNQYEQALAVWRALGPYESAFGPLELGRYAYLRGMTDYRLGFRDDARHWLAIAKATERRHAGSLDAAWIARLDGALGDLDREIFGIRVGGTDPVQSIEQPSEPIQPRDVVPRDAVPRDAGPWRSPPHAPL